MKNFTAEEEALIASFLFTNPYGDEGFVYPQPLVAGEELSPLMSAYSRTHVPFTRRVLQFLDAAKPEQTRALLPHMRPLMDIFRHPDGTLQISRRTMDFNREWVLAHGHSSIKEETNLFGWVENISDIAGKRITGHPRINPQVKSTRYLSYKQTLDRALSDPDILALPDAEQYVEMVRCLNDRYLAVTEQLADAVFGTEQTRAVVAYLRLPEQVEAEVGRWISRKKRLDPEFSPNDTDITQQREVIAKSLDDAEVRKDIGKFVLDSSRVYLPAATRTSLGFSADARTLEEVITELISSPRGEDQARGQAIWKEARKIAPVLLGEKSHIHVNPWKQELESGFRQYANRLFDDQDPTDPGREMVELWPNGRGTSPDFLAASLGIFPYVDLSLGQIINGFSRKGYATVSEALGKLHAGRGEHDVLHPALGHHGLMFQFTMPYHAYRDIFRHRRGARSWQLLTTRLGFEVPEIFSVFGLDEEYKEDMRRAAALYEQARVHSPHVAEKLVPFGANCRSLHSWSPEQVGYVAKIRGNMATGNRTYVRMARQLGDALTRYMPETAGFMRVDDTEYPPELWKKGYGWFDATQRA